MRARPIAIVAATAAAAIGGAMMIASKHRQFRRSTEADVREVFSASENGVGRAELDARWDTLPVPIQRHLTYAITTAAPSVRTARLRHAGTFRTGPEQRVVADRRRAVLLGLPPRLRLVRQHARGASGVDPGARPARQRARKHADQTALGVCHRGRQRP